MPASSATRTPMPVDTLWLQSFAVGSAWESLPLFSLEGGMLWRGAASVSGKKPCKEMQRTSVGLLPGAVAWASPAGSGQCQEEQKEAWAAKGCAATSQQDRCQISVMSL